EAPCFPSRSHSPPLPSERGKATSSAAVERIARVLSLWSRLRSQCTRRQPVAPVRRKSSGYRSFRKHRTRPTSTNPSARWVLIPPQRVFAKEHPHQLGGVDTAAGGPREPFRQRLAAGPGMAAPLDGVKHHSRVAGATRE